MSNDIFIHEAAYRGEMFLEKLSKMHITICGVGAIGSNLVDTLSRQGFSNLRVVDMDRVEIHNVNTQIYGMDDIGALKVDALKNNIFRVSKVEIETFNKELKSQTVKKFLKKTDLVVDAFDNSESRKLLQDFCRDNKIKLIHAGLFEDYGEVVWDEQYSVPANSQEGDVCDYPLARNLAVLVSTLTAEEIVNYALADKPRLRSVAVTLKDFKVSPYR